MLAVKPERDRCPSDLGLEGYLLDARNSGIALHVAGCASCQARVMRMKADGDYFQRVVFPATIGHVVKGRGGR